MGRPVSVRSYIRRELERKDLTGEQRLRLIELLAKEGKPKPWGNNLTKVRKKPARTERSLSPEQEARIKGLDKSKPVEKKAETLGEFLKDENTPAT